MDIDCCRTVPQRGPGRYAVDRDLEGRQTGPQRRYAHWGPAFRRCRNWFFRLFASNRF